MDEQDAESESGNPAEIIDGTLCFSPAPPALWLLCSHNTSATNNTNNKQAQLSVLAMKDV